MNERIDQVREVVPHFSDDAIEKLLQRCGGNVERAINAALEMDDGEPSVAAFALPVPKHPLELKRSCSNVTFTDEAGSSSKSEAVRRGSRVLLPADYLVLPEFRRSRYIVTASCVDYSVIYHRQNRSLGFSIQDIDGEIVIVNLDTQNPRKSLAMASGVQVGDIMVGINEDSCITGTDTQDIIELLGKSGQFIAIHFQRRFNCTGTLDTASFHPAIPLLAEQSLVNFDQISSLDKTIRQIKQSWLTWDEDALSERIEAWQLDEVLQDYWDDLIPADGNASPSPSSSSSSRRQSYSGREERETFSRRLSRRFSSGGSLDVAKVALALAERRYDESKSMRYVRPALAVHVLRADRPDKGSEEDVELVLWCCDIFSECEWVIKRKIKDVLDLRRKLIKAKHRVAAAAFPSISKGRVSSTTLQNSHLPAIQRFLREMLAMSHINPMHPSSIRVALLLQEFLNIREYMIQIRALQLQPATLHYRTVQVYVHQMMQLPYVLTVVDGFVNDFLASKVKDVSAVWNDDNAIKVLGQLKGFIDSIQTFICNCFRTDCGDLVSDLLTKGLNVRKAADCEDNNETIREKDFSSQSLDESDASAQEGNKDDLQTEDDVDGIIRSAIRKQVELDIYICCMGRTSFIQDRAYSDRDALLQAKVAKLFSQPQSYYDIPLDHISPCSWLPIVKAFQDIKNFTLPCDKIHHLLQLSKTIPALFRAEHPQSVRPLGADDLFPIFIYVVVQSRVPKLWTLNQELQQLCDPDKAFSESGYYLATLQACLSHLLDVDLDEERPFNYGHSQH